MLAATIGLAPVQSGDDWRAVSFNADWIKAIEASGVRASGAERTFWMATYYRTDQEDGTRYSVDRYTIDCTRQTIAVLHMTDYREGGDRLWSGEGTSVDPILPDSVAGEYASAVCENDWPGATPVESLKVFLQVAEATFKDMAAE